MPALLVSVSSPLRVNLTWEQNWAGPDEGIIACWERGRQKRLDEPDLALRAEGGELVTLAWRGGTETIEVPESSEGKTRSNKRYGTLNYLATWQGLRGEDLNIDTSLEYTIVCTRTSCMVTFRAELDNV